MERRESRIVECPACRARNRVPSDKPVDRATCGKCGSPLAGGERRAHMERIYVLRCSECMRKNRVPESKLDQDPICGKCGAALRVDVLYKREPVMITDDNFEEQVLKSPLPVLVFAWAPWCPTCRSFLPVIGGVAREARGTFLVGKLNVDQNPALASRYAILSVPRIIIFDRGEYREGLPGTMQQHEIMEKMSPYRLAGPAG